MIKINNISNWMIPDIAFDWIYKNINCDSSILELGSGFGSVVLGLNYEIYSVEQDENWIGVSSNVNYIYAPIKDGFYDSDILKKSLPLNYDLLLIDGPTQASGGRLGFIKNIDLFNLNCKIMIDDVHRVDEMQLVTHISKKLNREYQIYSCKNKKFAII